MTGPEHYKEAERLLTDLNEVQAAVQEAGDQLTVAEHGEMRGLAELMIGKAQVHATLALAAAAALNTNGGETGGMYLSDANEWEKACSRVVDKEKP